MSELSGAWKNGDFEARAIEGESPADCLRRVVPALEQVSRLPYKNVVVISHGRLLRILMAFLFEGTLDHMSLYTHHNTCINLIQSIRVASDLHEYAAYEPPKFALNYRTIETRTPPLGLPSQLPGLKWLPLVLDDHSHVPSNFQNT